MKRPSKKRAGDTEDGMEKYLTNLFISEIRVFMIESIKAGNR
jgi:hypothetical protein